MSYKEVNPELALNLGQAQASQQRKMSEAEAKLKLALHQIEMRKNVVLSLISNQIEGTAGDFNPEVVYEKAVKTYELVDEDYHGKLGELEEKFQ